MHCSKLFQTNIYELLLDKAIWLKDTRNEDGITVCICVVHPPPPAGAPQDDSIFGENHRFLKKGRNCSLSTAEE